LVPGAGIGMNAVSDIAPPQVDLELRGIAKNFGDFVALEHVDLSIERGEFVAIMGPSGCGKTTLLRIVAGLESMSSGRLFLRGQDISALPVHKRSTRLVWQNFALFPHLNVRQNIAFGLTLGRHDKAAVKARVAEIADLVQLGQFLDRRVSQLSGGQKQRVAIARALVTEPEILLLDEPLSALDAHLRIRMQSEMKRLQQRLGLSFLYVTHNQSEAFSMADRVVVMNKGRIEQFGPPEEIYTRPKTHFVAEFVGSNNIFDGKVVDVQGGLIRVQCADAIVSAAAGDRPPGRGSTVSLVVQADKVRSKPSGVAAENSLAAVLSGREFTGSQVIYYLETPSGVEVKMVAQEPFSQAERAAINMAMQLYWSPADTVVLRPNIVPGEENMPGGRSYVALGT
jgi:spermidine/putrescine transport system ATP-binding protein